MRTASVVAGLVMAGALWGATPAAGQPATTNKDRLAGLWRAKKHMGPWVRGTLMMERRPEGWTAEIAGRRASARVDGDRVEFELADGEGTFRGRLKDGSIVGHWIQPPPTVFDCRFATPVTLSAVGADRWRGTVEPLADEITLYMPLTLKSDGTLGAFLRNPEFNLGHTMTVVERAELDGATVKLVGRPEEGPEVVAGTGVFDSQRGVISISFPQAGGTYDFTRAGPVDEALLRPRPKTDPPYAYRPPVAEDDGWPVGTLQEAGISQEGISRFIQMVIDTPIDSVDAPEVHALLIARHGKLVLEEYFHGMHRLAIHDTRSAAKSLTSVLVGAAMLQGAPISPTTPVYQTMYGEAPDDPRKAAITVEHLLSMSAGLDCDDDNAASPGNEMTMQTQTAQPDWYRFTLDQKMVRAPGERLVYNSAGANLVGGVLAKTTGRWLPEAFRDWIAEPMQIHHYAINLTPLGEAYTGGGGHFRPRDFLKLPQMMMDGGQWHGRRIVGREWAERSTSSLREWPPMHYGYLWMVTEYPWQGGKVRAFFAAGNGGQIAMAIPELGLTLACYGGNYNHPARFNFGRKYVPDWILPAVSNKKEASRSRAEP